MADVELDVTFESSNVNLSTDFGTIYAVDDGVAVKIIANPYSSESTYEIGAYVIYNKLLYRCIVAVDVGEEFDPEKWSNIKLADDTKNKADTTYVDTELNKKADKNDTYTKTQIDNAVNNKMNKANPTGTGSFSLNRKSGSTVGQYSHAEGYNCEASGQGSHAEGLSTKSTGHQASHAEGATTNASGTLSHAEGFGSTASGDISHAEGSSTIASGECSHAEGKNTEARGECQHVFGKYNIIDGNNEFIEIVGNGPVGIWNERSNARTLDWSGNETLAGDLTYNGNKSLTSEISRLDGRIDDLPEAMVFKGTLGVGGTVETLPTASAENEGWTFKCITAGTYAGLTLKVGDSVTCFNPPNTSVYEWDISGHGDTDTDTWRAVKVNGTEVLGNGISSGSADFVGSENIDVEFDSNGNKIGIKTKNIYTKEEVDDIVYNILPDDATSGSVANFETDLAMPIKSLGVDVNAVQASGTPTPSTPIPISGWSQIGITRCGANLWDEVWELGTINNQTGQNADDSGMYRSKNYIQVPQGVNLYLVNGNSDTLGLRFYDSNKNFISARAFLASKAMTYGTNDLPTGTAYIRFVNTSTNVYLNNIAINYPSSDNAYHAFNGTTEVVNLGGNYYGGHFTQDKDGHRQFEVTHNYFDIGSTTWNSSADGYTQNKVDITDMKPAPSGNTKANFLCSSYKTDSPYNVYNKVENGTIAIAINQRLRVYDTRLTGMTGQQVQDALTGIYIAYEMVTPIVIDLPDGEPIITINGTNNIYADTGDTSVVFKDSVNGYVDKKIASVQALALNT